MTPSARVAAAADLLDAILAGEPAEKALTRWGRQSRFAGSGDRQAVRDHVFDALRRRRSYAALGGGETGRSLMLGALRSAGADPDALFTGAGHAPAPLTAAERATGRAPRDGPEAVDCPDWLWPRLQRDFGDAASGVMDALRQRAPLTLRANRRKGDRAAAAAALWDEGIETRPDPLAPDALEVVSGQRAVQRSRAFATGVVEIQDAGSQAVAEAIPLKPRDRVLDYCAGGGGKTLALAARADARFFAHDADRRRMSDLPERARRAGIDVRLLDTASCRAEAPFDLVVVDAPCSGSGAWRRSPDAKWRLTEVRLDALVRRQRDILDQAAALAAPVATLAYITCSLLREENGCVVAAFLSENRAWRLAQELRLTPLQGCDGFYLAVLARSSRRPSGGESLEEL